MKRKIFRDTTSLYQPWAKRFRLSSRMRCHRNRPSIGCRDYTTSSTRRYEPSGGLTASRPSFRISLCSYMYVRKEAVLSSSMIEGTQSSLSDLLLFELDGTGVPLDDVREVSNYVAALDYGLKRLAEGFPMSLRLIKEMHGVLLNKGRGANQTPGEFRKTQNWIGGTRPGNAAFVPPPADKVLECIGDLEMFLQDQPHPTPALRLKAALADVQFETIHPFLDGNGRLGRLLITLLLCEQKILREPMLYLSLYFKTHRQYYYELLNGVRLSGNWEAWPKISSRKQ